MIDLSGQDVGRYHILEPLGEGGMAKVYKAFDTHLECEVAVKVIRTDQLAPAMLDRTIKRFEREAKEVAKLSHPNIVRVMDYGEEDGVPYLVMQYLHGGTLKQFLGKQMPYQEAAALLVPIARALEYAHQHKMVHRDVKPANILVTDSGEPMLTDFGIVKMLDVEDGNTLTGTGVGLGTPQYMAPEQWMGNFAAEVDQYSLGVVFYELVTGHKPYNADTPAAVLLKQAADPLPRPGSFVPGLPDEVERVMLKSLAKNPKDRYASMGEMAQALAHLEQSAPTLEVTPPIQKFRLEKESGSEETKMEVPAKKSTPVQRMTNEPGIPSTPPPTPGLPENHGKIKKPLPFILGGVGCLILIAVVLGLALGWFKPTETLIPMLENTVLPATVSAPVTDTSKLKVCMATSGSITDATFNATAWQGVQYAVGKFGIEGKYLESFDPSTIQSNVNSFVDEKCDLIIGVGYNFIDSVKSAAETNPSSKFSGIDFSYDPPFANVVTQEFQMDQASFLAGYLAAGKTNTGTVGTFGGMNTPTITIFMDGFIRGVAYYNQIHGTNVRTIGWIPETQTGLFIDSFTDRDKAKATAIYLLDKGADVILPVAGPAGLGAVDAIHERIGIKWVIGVDSDWITTQPQYADIILTSVLKYMDVSTFNIIVSVVDGSFTGGKYVATLANGGVGIATLNSVVPADLLKELEQVKADIIAGKIKFNSVYTLK